MTWSNAITELRTELSDGPADKRSWRKKVFGDADGTNKSFTTFEFRRVTDFVTAAYPLGIIVNGSTAAVTSDDHDFGQFELTNAPPASATIEATYFHQWFTDAQLDTFLVNAVNVLGVGPSYTNLIDGLKPAAKKYACANAYMELSVRYARMLSEQYRVEDTPKEVLKETQERYAKLAQQNESLAIKLAQFFYSRSGKNFEPAWDTVSGEVPRTAPNR